jgi:hypothetical protein
MKYFIEILVEERSGSETTKKFKKVKPTQGSCYQYDTTQEAEDVLKMCYPESTGKRRGGHVCTMENRPVASETVPGLPDCTGGLYSTANLKDSNWGLLKTLHEPV